MRALVLRKTKYGEKDCIVRFFTESGEIVSTFAASARNSKRRFPHQFDFSGIYEIETKASDFNKKKDQLVRLHRCDLLEFSSSLKNDWAAIARWAVVMDWIHTDEIFSAGFEDILKLRAALIADAPVRTGAFVEFLASQIETHGIRPQTQRCVSCHEIMNTAKDRLLFSHHQGGVLHSTCPFASHEISPLSLESYQALQSIFGEKKDEEEESASVSSYSSFLSIELLLIEYLERQLGKPLRSKFFLQELDDTSAASRQKK